MKDVGCFLADDSIDFIIIPVKYRNGGGGGGRGEAELRVSPDPAPAGGLARDPATGRRGDDDTAAVVVVEDLEPGPDPGLATGGGHRDCGGEKGREVHFREELEEVPRRCLKNVRRRERICNYAVTYRQVKNGLYVVGRTLLLLLLTCSAWP